MKIMDIPGDRELHLARVRVLSGTRPAGRRIDKCETGRRRHGFFYLKSGQAQFWQQDQNITVREDQLVFLPKGARYTMAYTAPDTAFVLIDFDIQAENAPVTAVDIVTPVEGEFGKTILSLERWGMSEGLAAALRRKELLYRLLGQVFEKDVLSGVEGPVYPQIAPGTLLLQNAYMENIPITELAKASNVSVSSFRDLFKKQFGESPVRYRNRLRIQRAAALLEEGSCTVAEAAYASGFDNVGYFCRCYKKLTGKTPTQSK